MRRAMMCVTVMLVILQLWPIVFGAAGSSALAAPVRSGAAVMLVPPSRPLAADGAGNALASRRAVHVRDDLR